LIIQDHVDLHRLRLGDSYEEMAASLMKEASDLVPAEIIRDFCEKNRQRPAIWPEIIRHLPAVLLSRDEEHAIFEEGPAAGWGRLHSRYPDAACRVWISRVGLSREKDRALFYVGYLRGPDDGGSHLYVLKKHGGEWGELPVRFEFGWEA
jgi:hypothetical protein